MSEPDFFIRCFPDADPDRPSEPLADLEFESVDPGVSSGWLVVYDPDTMEAWTSPASALIGDVGIEALDVSGPLTHTRIVP